MGKQHGTIAKAGKVKAQTPKIEKKEKRKQPRGRAKKRMQFNRRFSSKVKAIGGPKKGPNSQSK